MHLSGLGVRGGGWEVGGAMRGRIIRLSRVQREKRLYTSDTADSTNYRGDIARAKRLCMSDTADSTNYRGDIARAKRLCMSDTAD